MRDFEEAVAAGPYSVVIGDPPWDYYGDPNKWAAAGKYYNLMSDEELYALPVPRLLDKRAVVFLWTTSSALHRTIKCYEAWGLHYRGIAFVWIKTKADGKTPIGPQGVRPSIIKPLTELVLVGATVPRGRPLPVADEGISQTIFAPRGRHSEKPEAVQDAIERLYPGQKMIELFGRRQRPGWVVWGNEAPE